MVNLRVKPMRLTSSSNLSRSRIRRPRKTSLLVFAMRSIPHDRQFQAGLSQFVSSSRCLDIRAFPDITRILPAHIGKGRQDPAGKAVQAAVDTDLTFERGAEVLEQEVLADGGGDVLPREDFVGAALAVGV